MACGHCCPSRWRWHGSQSSVGRGPEVGKSWTREGPAHGASNALLTAGTIPAHQAWRFRPPHGPAGCLGAVPRSKGGRRRVSTISQGRLGRKQWPVEPGDPGVGAACAVAEAWGGGLTFPAAFSQIATELEAVAPSLHVRKRRPREGGRLATANTEPTSDNLTRSCRVLGIRHLRSGTLSPTPSRHHCGGREGGGRWQPRSPAARVPQRLPRPAAPGRGGFICAVRANRNTEGPAAVPLP